MKSGFLPSYLRSIPDIIITNYSMLEYMLCRPQDREFFGPALRYIVLDEAHLYTGTLAAEITLLLRRVRDRCGVSPGQLTHIATSAALGGTKSDLESFAATVFSVPGNLVKIVAGKTAPLPKPQELATAQPPSADQLAQHLELELVTLNADGEFVDPDPEALRRLRPALLNLLPDDAISSAEASAKGKIPTEFNCGGITILPDLSMNPILLPTVTAESPSEKLETAP
jgi:DEAD/DEAH box helicase domain-containing protein